MGPATTALLLSLLPLALRPEGTGGGAAATGGTAIPKRIRWYVDSGSGFISPTFTEDPFALEKATVVSKSILAPTQAVQAHVRVAPMQVAGRQSLTTDGIARTIRLTNGKPWTFDGVYGDRENNRHIFFNAVNGTII